MDLTFSFADNKDNAPSNKKRRFAPASIQTFTSPFTPDMMHNSINIDDQPLLQQTDGQVPTSEDIERELLQVGMRVRKAISEGYKTSAFTPRPFFNTGSLSPETQAALCTSTSTMNRQPLSTATYCGINLAALAHISSHPAGESRSWTYTTNHKRGYEGDSDSDDQEFMPHTPTLGVDEDMLSIPVDYFNIDFDDVDYENISPLTQPHELMASRQRPGRKLAIPRSRRQDSSVVQQEQQQEQQPCVVLRNPFATVQMNGTQWMGHRRMGSCGVEAKLAYDYGEASFLQRREDVDMDWS